VSLSRRQFVGRAGAAALPVVLAPGSALSAAAAPKGQASKLLRGARFAQGVLSGDPTVHSITLLTALEHAGGTGGVRVEVARDPHFRHVVARQTLTAGPSTAHAIKARVTGLRAHERYWYRFETRDAHSPVGRFQTAPPADSHQPVRFAFFSCAEYSHGYYNGYARMAEEDVDFVICLGDYIYAETYTSTQNGKGVRDDRIGRENPDNPDIVREAVTLADYRAKYALYRSDPHLRAMHANFPMIAIGDDHEVQDNYAGGEPDGGLPPGKHYSAARRAAADRAFAELMPFFGRGPDKRRFRVLKYGPMDIFMIDERAYRANQPCNDAVTPPCADWQQPRDFLGQQQMGFLQQELSASKAPWKVIGNEVTMMPTKVLGGAYYTYDNWQGYPTEREQLLQYIKAKGVEDVVFVTGDIHTFITGDVRTQMGDGETIAPEFVGGSITSQGLGEIDLQAGGGAVIKGNDAHPDTPAAIIDTLKTINPWVDKADFDHHGYGVATASRRSFDVSMRRLQTIKRRTTALEPSKGWNYSVARGQRSIKGTGT
jgi:alkaline phosphatase D